MRNMDEVAIGKAPPTLVLVNHEEILKIFLNLQPLSASRFNKYNSDGFVFITFWTTAV